MPSFPVRLFRCALLLGSLAGGWLPAQTNSNPLRTTGSSAVPQTQGETQSVMAMRFREMREERETKLQELFRDPTRSAGENGPAPVFLPPMTPALLAARAELPELPYPVALADFAGEIFFMANASLYYFRQLAPPEIERITRYRDTRNRLAAELRARLAEFAGAPPADRQRELAAFAVTQDSALHALETEAEAIRTALTKRDDGAALLALRDTFDPAQVPQFAVYLSAVLAAQYHAGLSLDQRQLLQEMALASLLATEPGVDSPRFFSPATARVHLPQAPGPELVAKLRQFHELREALQTELRQTVLAGGKAMRVSTRTKKYAALAEQEAPRFAALHGLAEEIRVALAGQPAVYQPEPTTLPTTLIQQVGRSMDRSAGLQRTARRQGREFSWQLAPERVRLVTRENLPILEILPPDQPAGSKLKTSPERVAVLGRLQAYNAELQRHYLELGADMENVRAAVQQYHVSLGSDQGGTVEKLTARLARAYQQQTLWTHFRGYHDAVLQPGLSPAQRRVLLQSSLAALEKHRLETAD